MKVLFAFATSLLGLAIADEAVVTLTDSTFEETIKANDFVLAEFYAPWCGHCKKLAPEYENAAQKLKEYDPKVVIAKVDATAETALASTYEVRGFPTLKWFVKGQPMDYTGGRTEETIVSWIKKKTGPPADAVKTAAGLEEFKKQADAVVVGVFDSPDTAEAKAFLDSAMTDDDVPYGVCYNSDSEAKCEEIAEAGVVEGSKAQKVIIFKSFDDKAQLADVDLTTTSALAEFISSNSLPLVVPFSQQNAPKIFGGDIGFHFLMFVDDAKDEVGKKLVEDVTPVAKTQRGKVLFVTVEKNENRLYDFFGIDKTSLPTVRMVKMVGKGVQKFKFTEEVISEATVSAFVTGVVAGEVPLDLKSEEPVPEAEQGPVRVVVGKDFDQVTSQPGVDVLVEFYAPWCGHCKKLEPEYNAAGEHFKDNKNVVIAKMDATANEVEKVTVSGFPTLKFFPADSDEIVDFDGERTTDGIISFLNKNAKSLQ